MDSHHRSQRANIHHKSLDILIQRRLSKFLLINDFDSVDDWKGFFDGIDFLGKLFLSKLNVSITKSKQGHA